MDTPQAVSHGAPAEVLVAIDRVEKSYHRGDQIVPVLRECSLSILAGEFLALMGPSGSGKTTLLNLIAGIDKPDSGSILIGGIDIAELSESELAAWRAAHIGFVFQFYNLMPVLSAYENVELPLLLTPLTRSERREHVEIVLSMVGLQDRMDHFPSQLSGGQQQRVAIARALVTDPTLIVADEPTGDLDRVSGREVLQLLEHLNDQLGKTIIMVTHDQQAAELAGVIRHLDKGVLLAEEHRTDFGRGGLGI